MSSPSISVLNPSGGGMGISTTPYAPGSMGTGYGSSALSSFTKALMQKVLERADEAAEDRQRARINAGSPHPQEAMAKEYALQQLRDATINANQRAAPAPTRDVTGPQIIPGKTIDPTKLTLGNLPSAGRVDPGYAAGTAPGATDIPWGGDELAAKRKQVQMAALAKLGDKITGTGDSASGSPAGGES